MTALEGRLRLDRTIVTEYIRDPNVERVHIVAGSSGGVGGGSPKTTTVQQSGNYRQYGNGNIRLILGSAKGRNTGLALRALTPSQTAQMERILGQTIIYRTPLGQKIIGAFLELTYAPIPFSGRFEDDTLQTDVGLTIQEITFDEVV